MGHVNVVASLIFSGMSGSAVADAAGIGKIIIEMMTKSGHYTRGYAAAITAASATIGPIIPPSIPMVLYALVSNTSIGFLFLGGIVPGLFMGVVLMGMNYVISHRRGFRTEDPVPLRELPALTVNAFPALLMPAILLYGIYGGVTTPTEAAAVAAFYALILAAVFYRALSVGAFYRILVESARSSAAVGLVIGGALILNFVVVASENIPGMLANALVGIEVEPIVFLLAVNVLILLLGCVLDATTIILVIIPLFLPSCRELGIDLVHFGVVAVVNCMIGLITPPYGILVVCDQRRHAHPAGRDYPRGHSLPRRIDRGLAGADLCARPGALAAADVRVSRLTDLRSRRTLRKLCLDCRQCFALQSMQWRANVAPACVSGFGRNRLLQRWDNRTCYNRIDFSRERVVFNMGIE